MGKRILLTGGAGFIGTALARDLLAKGHEVTIIDTLSPQIHGEIPGYSPPDGVRFVRADVRHLSEMSDLLEPQDVVFHLAAETGTGQSMYKIARYVDVNEMGTAQLLEGLGRCSRRKRRVILASSRSIYGEGAYADPARGDLIVQPEPRTPAQLASSQWDFANPQGQKLKLIPTPETLPAKPGSVYAATKMAQELLLRSAADALGIEPVILRFQNVYGEGQSLRNPYTGIISIFYNRIRQNLPINIFEDGLESRDFVHVSDIVRALTAALDGDKPPMTALNVGSGVATSVLDIARHLCQLAGLSPRIEVTGDYRVGDIRHCYADMAAIKAAFGFEPQVSISDGLGRFVAWASTQPAYEDKSAQATAELTARGLAKA